jgi:hypothetical protein
MIRVKNKPNAFDIGLNSSGRTRLEYPNGYISNACLPSYIMIRELESDMQK